MSNEQKLISTSKFLSLVLRHKPEVIGVELDSEGWLDVNKLVLASNQHGKPLTLELVHEVVVKSDKKRFALSEDGLRIRANQGHSIAGVDLKLEQKTPPAKLYHGTVKAFIESIRASGLQKRSRHHVHLSADEGTATAVGARRGQPIIVQVAAQMMHQDGHAFYLSANGVWLVDTVPVTYLTFPT